MIKPIVKNLSVLAIISFLAYGNLTWWRLSILGWVILFVYLSFLGKGATLALRKFFNFHNNWRTRWLGIFFGYNVFGFSVGALITFGIYNYALLAITMFLVGMLFVALKFWSRHALAANLETKHHDAGVVDTQSNVGFALLAFVLLFSLLLGLYLLILSGSGAEVSTPWKLIHPAYIYVFWLSTLLIGRMIFSPVRSRFMLFLLIFYLLIQHLYLPATHPNIYGADGWRHAAMVNRIIAGQQVEPILSDTNGEGIIKQMNLGQLSYRQFLGQITVISSFTNITAINILAWLNPILWSLFLSIILYDIGRALRWSKSAALMLVWLSGLPFALQANGAITLPVGTGLIWFLFLILLLIRRGSHRRWEQLAILFSLGVLSVFGYALYLLLFWLILLVSEVVAYKMPTKHGELIKSCLLVTACVAFLPAVEIFSRYSQINLVKFWLPQLKLVIQNFSGYFLVGSLPNYDFSAGNILFNQVRESDFVLNLFTATPISLMLFSIGIYAVAFVGWVRNWKSSHIADIVLNYLALSVGAGYIIGRYLLFGDQILSRRLDALAAILLIIYAWKGFCRYFDLFDTQKRWYGGGKWMYILLISSAMAASYSLGPHLRAISVDQYNAMKYVWERSVSIGSKSQAGNCVIADTYPLLALEAISARQIIGGGFPMSNSFAQKELGQVYRDLLTKDDYRVWDYARKITGAPRCFLVANVRNVRYNIDSYVVGNKLRKFGNIIVWEN